MARRDTRVSEEIIVKALPVDGAEPFEKIGQSQIGLALTQDLVSVRKECKGNWVRFENGENAFKENIRQNRIGLGRG